MAIDNEIKIRHLESKMRDEELAAYFDGVKLLSPTELASEIKTLKTAKINAQIAALQDELAKL